MQETTERAGRGRIVVVVEDNVRSRRLVRDLLELNGFVPVEAESAEEGLAAIRAEAPCLVLLDIQLPGMDGEEALRLLRADPEIAHIPAVAVTAYAMRGDEERFLAVGFDGYIAKPIDTRTFTTQLIEILDAHGRRSNGGAP